MPLVTLTTDFGDGSTYVAAMKGVLLSLNPRVQLVDLCHRIPPQDVRAAAYFLQASVPYYPAETLHVVVVDPGVGTNRYVLCVEIGEQLLLAPDNGCWTSLLGPLGAPTRVLRLTEERFWRPQVSATFHGRDIFAPVAAHLTLGVDPDELGEPVEQWVELPLPEPVLSEYAVLGAVVHIDTFGNLLTNIPAAVYLRWHERPLRITVGSQRVEQRVFTYGEAPPGSLVALLSSQGTVEIAVTCGSAAERLGVELGTEVSIVPEG